MLTVFVQNYLIMVKLILKNGEILCLLILSDKLYDGINHWEGEVIVLLTHCGLEMTYGDIDLSQHWLRQNKPLSEPVLTSH